VRDTEDALAGDTSRWVEALTWYERLTEADQAELTSALIREWQTWHADAENQRIFDHVSRLIADAGRARRGSSRSGDFTEDDYDPGIPIALWRRTRVPPSALHRLPWVAGRSGFIAMVAAVAAAIAGALWVPLGRIAAQVRWESLAPRTGGWSEARRQSGAITFETAVGELKNVDLRDGSRITLGGGTKLVVDLSARTRSVELIEGEAWFRVAHNPNWPFIVDAGNGAITAVGTAFLVTRDSDLVVVTVTEGAISVRAPPPVSFASVRHRQTASPRTPSPVRVTRGEEVSYHDNGTVTSVVAADTHAATAWTQGRLIFDNQPLRYVIEGVNRYSARHILVTSSAGRLRFSGVILLGEFEEWLQRLPAVVPVDVEQGSAAICIRLHSEEAGTSCTGSPGYRIDRFPLF
jgi:ferric-dicitrate binding protein FerR (iron transport regulator)